MDDAGIVERQARELEARARGRDGALVAGIRDDQDEEPFEAELCERGTGEGDVTVVRRVERSAEDPYCHSSVSPSTSTSAPRLMPVRRRASSSSSVEGGWPTTR